MEIIYQCSIHFDIEISQGFRKEQVERTNRHHPVAN